MRNCGEWLAALSLTLVSAQSLLAGSSPLDSTFASGGVALLAPTPSSALQLDRLQTIAVDAQNRILLGGMYFDIVSGEERDLAAIGRLLADGNWDETFGNHGIFVLPFGASVSPNGGSADHIQALSDGILVSGTSFQTPSLGRLWYKNSCILLLKLTNAGQLDTTFASDHSGTECFDFAPQGDTTGFAHPNTIVALPNGSFYATTFSTNLVQDSLILGAVARFDAFGVLDSGYGSAGIAVSPIAFFSLNLLSGQQLLGSSAAVLVGAASIDAAGSFNDGYGEEGVSIFDPQQGLPGSQPGGARLDASQRLVSGMSFYKGIDGYGFGLVRLTTDGQPDATFNPENQQSGTPGVAAWQLSDGDHDFLTDVMPLPDGHIFVLGESGHVAAGDGDINVALVRLNDDSSFDVSFGDAAHPGWSSVNVGGTDTSSTRPYAMAADSAGRVLVAIASQDGSNHCVGVARIVADRLLGASFDLAASMPSCPQ
jgi:uncharacterized delta-60 repeat protein